MEGKINIGRHIFKVDSEFNGKRLDHYLMGMGLGISRSKLKKLINNGLVLLNGERTKESKKLKEGMVIEVEILETAGITVEPEEIPLEILYEDEYFIAINKKAGIVTHPASGSEKNTLVNAILSHCKEIFKIGDALRPGVVHRLDKETSGVMIFAKTEEAYEKIKKEFKERRVKKIYLAIVLNSAISDSGEFHTFYGRNPKNRKKFTSRLREGKEAITKFKTLSRAKFSALMEVHPLTGRTHQIRVHFSEHSHPLLGEKIYAKGYPSPLKKVEKEYEILKKMSRQALHSVFIRFFHPFYGEKITIVAKIPEDMEYVVKNVFPDFDIDGWFSKIQ